MRHFNWVFTVFVAVLLGCTSTGRVGLCFVWFFVQELPKAQPAVVMVLKRLRRRGNGLKSHPTDWEKPGLEPATPGLQDIGLYPTPRRLLYLGVYFSVAVFLGCTSTGRVGLCCLWFYVQELPKAQPAVVMVLKRLRRRGNDLKSHPTDWEKPGIEPAIPGLQDMGLSPTPRVFTVYKRVCTYCKCTKRTSIFPTIFNWKY